MQSKNVVSKCLETFLNEAKNAGHTVKEVLSDGGGVVINSTVKSILEKFGISSRMLMPYTPEQNGAAERENRTIVGSAKSIIYATNLPLKLWEEAVNTSVYVLNRTGATSVKKKCPYELWFSKQVISTDHLRVFGTECFVCVSQQKRRKWDKKSVKGVFVGYSGEKDGYRIRIKDQNKVILSRDVIFQKEKSSCVLLIFKTQVWK
ncbi:retrovirus-related Pol polyprotein from transposon TNT 1-94 [Trichonephila inaurata madagascariensis]|uniref:Retrovirus-related Pol polyprotein from transposon TNT 1-94 n=1 Tax=Trichonephila inaurata madagascariensis TaxID=2747483 RepID=A0A8X6XEV2_9ARAC|nr:retrovirus-related Pol polyprotein from transposon TNT 1-94 [Trichonephila inaurata madagascariensis]